MTDMGAGKTVYHLRKKIDEIQKELSQLGKPVPDIQEIITSTNLLRSNERLSKIDEKQNELLTVYAQHSKVMEELLTTVFEIQIELKEILKEQSSLISNPESEIISKVKSEKK
jgi:phage-related tail protein